MMVYSGMMCQLAELALVCLQVGAAAGARPRSVPDLALRRVDAAAAIAPGALVGRQVRLLWPKDDAWFLGSVEAYDAASGKHRVRPALPAFSHNYQACPLPACAAQPLGKIMLAPGSCTLVHFALQAWPWQIENNVIKVCRCLGFQEFSAGTELAGCACGGLQVAYEDGDAEEVLLCDERVRLEVHAPEALPPPCAAELRAAAAHLSRMAGAAPSALPGPSSASEISCHACYLGTSLSPYLLSHAVLFCLLLPNWLLCCPSLPAR